jgi:hypothetical protein
MDLSQTVRRLALKTSVQQHVSDNALAGNAKPAPLNNPDRRLKP